MDELERLNREKYFGALYNVEEEQKRLEASAEMSGYKRGMKEGHNIGAQEGSQSAKKEIAKSLLENGTDIEIVSKCTGLSVEKLEKLKY